MATLSCLGNSKGKGIRKWLSAFEAVLEIRYHFTPTENKLEPIINVIIFFPMSLLSNFFSSSWFFLSSLDPSNHKSRNWPAIELI